MEELLSLVASNPFTAVTIFLAVWGAVGAIIFLWGFVGYFLSHGNVDHQYHARGYMLWGILLLGAAILVWKGIGLLLGFF